MAREEADKASSWQAELEVRFAPSIDPALIAALVSEPGQTLEGAAAVLETLSVDQGEEAHPAVQHSKASGPAFEGHADEAEADTDLESAQVQRALQEWSLIDKDQQPLADSLRLTDDEEAEEANENVKTKEEREAERLGKAAADDLINPIEVAAGHGDVGPPGSEVDGSGLDLLTHAFPARTPIFLEETLRECNGDVTQTLDHLMVLEMVENGEASAEFDWPVTESQEYLGDVKKGIDYEKLSEGVGGRKKMSKSERKRLRQRQAEGAYSAGPQKISLGDVRHGAPIRSFHPARRVVTGTKKSLVGTGVQEDDAAMAARLDKEEREEAGIADDEDPAVKDNDWLFSSSILDQIATLLDLPSHKTRSTYHSTSFNLRATTLRLVVGQAQRYPNLATLDDHIGEPPGTAKSMVDSLCAISPAHRTVEDVHQAFKATAARPDATLDLLELLDVVQEASHGTQTDFLDPLARNSSKGDAVIVDVATKTQTAGPAEGTFVWTGEDDRVNGRPAYSGVAKRRIPQTQAQDSQSGDGRASNRTALQALRAGAASTSYPAVHASSHANPSSSDEQIGSFLFTAPSSNQVVSSAQKRAQECKAISEDYRARREECLRKASSAYRNRTSLPSASVSRSGVGRGASAAWYYADEARRLDAKARAWSLRAAQALVQDRVHTSRGDGNSRGGGDRIDLHGLTVHEALTITRDALAAWWAKSGSGNKMPLTIVTGVGRHSRGNVAVIRPAVLGMLKRDGWRVDENAGQGLITVRGLA